MMLRTLSSKSFYEYDVVVVVVSVVSSFFYSPTATPRAVSCAAVACARAVYVAHALPLSKDLCQQENENDQWPAAHYLSCFSVV